ncbi:histidine kinase N-terminal 7TM domain-containing protein [Haloarchaeobius sp. DFWS5]|uniref:histidine kinase N-terminal 7TM domain-containing protein n=1 Tax=Haloarchaeobius sp. DFWS5 TaxID=3446114 RepID=UPI003EC13FEF
MAGVNPYFGSLVVVTILLVSIFVVGWQRRDEPAVEPFLVLTAGVVLWTVGYALEVPTQTQQAYLAYDQVMWLGVVLVPPAWLVFTLDYTGRESVLTRPVLAGLGAVTVLDYTLYTWNPNGAYYTVESFAAAPPVANIEFVFGPLFWIHLVLLYVETLVGAALLVELLLTSTVYRRRALALLVVVAAPSIANLVTIFDLVQTPLDITPYSFAVSSLAVGYVLFDQQLFDSLPVTRALTDEAIVAALSGGIVVVDAEERIVDYNEPAADLVENGAPVHGTDLCTILPAVADTLDESAEAHRSVDTVIGSGSRHYAATVSTVERRDGTAVGYVVSLHDVTQRVLREQRLDVLNRVLRHNVRQEATLVLGHTEGMAPEQAVVVNDAVENLVALSDRARQVTAALDEDHDGQHDVVDLVPTVTDAVQAARDSHPDAVVTAALPDTALASAHPATRRAIDEVLDNAVRHDPEPTPSVDVSIDVTGEVVTVSVADEAPLIPESERTVLRDGGETALEHGDGLGLWLVSWIARSSGGDVQFDRTDRGNVVRLSFPVAS